MKGDQVALISARRERHKDNVRRLIGEEKRNLPPELEANTSALCVYCTKLHLFAIQFHLQSLIATQDMAIHGLHSRLRLLSRLKRDNAK